MSNLVSLDDIIKKSKTSTMRNRGPPRKPAVKVGVNGANGAAPKPRIRSGPIEDARFKIIQKKRKTITDARDKLAQIAKQSDARLKLQKLRANNTKKVVDASNVLRKNGRNGRLTSSKPIPPRGPRSMPAPYIPPPRTMSYRPPPMPETHYVNSMMRSYGDEYLMGHHHHQAALRRTVSNEYTPSLPPPPPMFNIKPTSYGWDKPSYHTSSLTRSQTMRSSDHSSRPRDYKVIPTRSPVTKIDPSPYHKNDWSFSSKSRTIIPESSMESKYYSMRNHRDVGVKSRLDSPPPLKSSRTIASSSRPKTSSQSAGYRIVVSNLQPNVTQEDIKELFEDVGDLLVSRLVRPGIAEVVYKTLKDASKAVDTYHNRQLDGHPMKCLLVNSAPKASSSSSSSSRVLSQSRSSSNNYSQRNLGTMYRALFD